MDEQMELVDFLWKLDNSYDNTLLRILQSLFIIYSRRKYYCYRQNAK